MKKFKLLIIIIFFLILIVPIIFINTMTDQVSLIDNTKLPELSTVINLNTFEEYLSKRIGFRNNIIKLYVKSNDVLFKEMIHPSYTYGTDGYVFFKIGVENYDNEYLDNFALLIKNIQNYVNERGSYFLFFINPSKISVYKDYLPKGYKFNNYRINYLKTKLEELGVNYVDNYECLAEISKKEQIFNIKYDAGHWNDLGTFYGINNIYNKLNSDGINISNLDFNDYNITYENQKSLPISEFEINEDVPVFNLKNEKFIFTDKYENDIMINNNAKYYKETYYADSNNNYKLLFFRDSYLNSKEKFVAEKFKETYFVHSYFNAINVDYYYNITSPNIVLMDAVEYAIKENYYPLEDMKNKKYNPNYIKFKDIKNDDFYSYFDISKIVNLINNNFDNNINLTRIDIENRDFSYAYLKVDNNIYDFIYDNTNSYITLDTLLLKNSKEIELILISKNQEKKQFIKIR